MHTTSHASLRPAARAVDRSQPPGCRRRPINASLRKTCCYLPETQLYSLYCSSAGPCLLYRCTELLPCVPRQWRHLFSTVLVLPSTTCEKNVHRESLFSIMAADRPDRASHGCSHGADRSPWSVQSLLEGRCPRAQCPHGPNRCVARLCRLPRTPRHVTAICASGHVEFKSYFSSNIHFPYRTCIFSKKKYFFSYYSFSSQNMLYSASKQHLGWRAHAPTVPTMPQLSPPRWNSARALPRRQSTSNSRTPAPPRRQARLGSHTRIAWNRWTPCTARATITGVPHASHDQIPGRLPSALGTSPRGRRAMDHHRRGRRLVRSLGQWCGARVTCRGFPFQSCSRRQRRCSSLCFARVQRHYSKARRTGVRTRRWRAGWRHDSATSYSYRSPLTPCRHRRFAAIVVAWPRQTDLVASRPRIWGMATYGACGLAGDVDRPPRCRDSKDESLRLWPSLIHPSCCFHLFGV